MDGGGGSSVFTWAVIIVVMLVIIVWIVNSMMNEGAPVKRSGHHAFYTKIKGVAIVPHRQQLISTMPIGAELELKPEPSNPVNPNAIAVLWQGNELGYLNDMRAEQISVATSRYPQARFWARVKDITGENPKGVNIQVLCNGKVTEFQPE
jgi:hypothetical protein